MESHSSEEPYKPIHLWQYVGQFAVLLVLHSANQPSVAVSTQDFNPGTYGNDFYIMLNDMFVVTARPFEGFQRGQISLSDPQRTWAQISLQDTVNVRLYDPFSEGGDRYLGSIDAEVGFAGRKTTADPLDQDELAKIFISVSFKLLNIVLLLTETRITQIKSSARISV